MPGRGQARYLPAMSDRSTEWMVLGAAMAAWAGTASAAPPVLTIAGAADARSEWVVPLASPREDWINDLVPIANGNVLAVGFLNRDDDAADSDWVALAAEISPAGILHSQQRFGEGGGRDAFWSVAEGTSGRMFAGFTTRIGNGGIDGWAMLAGADGKLIAERGLGGAGYDRFTDITQAGDGFALLGHSQLADSDRRRAFLVKTGADGGELWSRIFDGPGSWGALYVEPSGDGGFVISGGVSGEDGGADMFVIRTDGEGRELWRKRIGTPDWDEINHGLVVRPDGRIVLVGYTHPVGGDSNDLVAATLDRHGELLRMERVGGSGDERARLPKLAADGRIWIAGHSDSAGAGGSDALIVALDGEGRFTDHAILVGTAADDIGTAVLPMPDGSLMLAGYGDAGASGEDAFVAALVPQARPRSNPAFRRVVVTPAR
jgi:hypothetical protein